MSNIVELPMPYFTFGSRLIESVRMIACVEWLSLLEAIQRRACVTAAISIVKLDVVTLYFVTGGTVFVDGGRTLLCSDAPP